MTLDFPLSRHLHQRADRASTVAAWRRSRLNHRPGNVRLQAKKMNHTIGNEEVTPSAEPLLTTLAIFFTGLCFVAGKQPYGRASPTQFANNIRF